MKWIDLVVFGLGVAKMIAELSTYTGDDKIVREAGAALVSFQRIRSLTKDKAALDSLRLSVNPWPKE